MVVAWDVETFGVSRMNGSVSDQLRESWEGAGKVGQLPGEGRNVVGGAGWNRVGLNVGKAGEESLWVGRGS